jgi:uncharacterized protein YlxW (UPF0749 family)
LSALVRLSPFQLYVSPTPPLTQPSSRFCSVVRLSLPLFSIHFSALPRVIFVRLTQFQEKEAKEVGKLSKIVKKLSKIVKKLSKVVKKLSKSVKKLSKSFQKFSKVVKKLSKSESSGE